MRRFRRFPVKIVVHALLSVALVGLARAQLNVDFGRPGSNVQPGYEAWTADHEVAAAFADTTFAAFDTNVTVGVTFNFTQPQGMQMILRELNQYNTNTAHLPDLMYEWTGIDPRNTAGLPTDETATLTVTLTGLPAGKYNWLSYHHDTDNQRSGFTYAFDDALLDVSGSGDITDNDVDKITNLTEVAKLNALFYSDGVTPVTAAFSTIGTTIGFFFVFNGFEIESLPDLPEFDQHPQNQTRILGATPATNTFTTTVLSLEPPTYQWRKDTVVLPAETNSALVLVDGDIANYDVIVSNSAGSVTSLTATIVDTLPPINESDQAIARLAPATISITMPVGPAYTYQWQKDGEPISGADSNSYSIAEAYRLHSGAYTVDVTHDGKTVTSDPAQLTVQTLTFIRATHGTVGSNTFGTATGSYTNWGTPLERPNTDNLWGEEETQVYTIPGGGMWSWESAGAEDSPGLTTVATGLVSDVYAVYALWAGHGRNAPTTWDILAGLSGNPLQLFNENNSTRVTSDGDLGDAHIAYVGSVTGSVVSIDIDDTPTGGGVGSTDRTRYIGIAYELKENPDISLTAPADGTVYAANSTVALAADASSPIADISKVEFLVYDTKIGEATNAPFSTTWENVPGGYYPIRARATDAFGQTVDSDVAAIQVGTSKNVMLLVSDAGTPGGADPSVIQYFRSRGASVNLVSGPGSTVADADGMDLLVISSTITSGDGAKYRDVTIPILDWEQAVQDELEMSHANGSMAGQTDISIVQPDHPMAAGLTGTIAVLSVADGFSYGGPTGMVEVVATAASNPERALIYGYDAGVEMENGLIAPARRAFIFLDDDSYNKLTPSGLLLFDAAVNWALASRPESIGTVLIVK